jgi:hypothetical protein
MISPRLSKVVGGTRLTTDLLNSMIKRTEYAADLLQQYKLIAGNQMYIEPHYDGTRVSYLQPVGGGVTPTQPLTKTYSIPWNTRDDFLNGQLFPVSLAGTSFPPSAWSSLLNLYAVWVNPGVGFPSEGGIDHIFEYKINFDETTLYKISSSGDDKCTVFLDGTQILISTNPGSIATTTIQITAGLHKVKTVGFNNVLPSPLWTLNPGGWAVLIDYA